jgi:hypothetical protein
MFGTTTLAEIKKKLIDRYGCLPDFSAEARKVRQREEPPTTKDMSELEKSLFAVLDELDREIKKANCSKVGHVDQADEPMISYRESPNGGKQQC